MDEDGTIHEAGSVTGTAPAAEAGAASEKPANENTDGQEHQEVASEGQPAASPEPEKKYTDKDMAAMRKKHEHETRKERDQRIALETELRIRKELEASKSATPAASVPENSAPVKPDRDQFDTTAEFDAAMIDYVDKVSAFNVKQATRQLREEIGQKTASEQKQDAFNKHLSDGRGKFKDFDEVVTQTEEPISPEMLDIILRRDNNAEIAYHLSKNPDECARIKAIQDPVERAAEIGALSHQLKTVSSAPPVKKPITGSPPPPATLQAASTVSKMTIKDAKTSEDRFKIWDEEKAAGRKR